MPNPSNSNSNRSIVGLDLALMRDLNDHVRAMKDEAALVDSRNQSSSALCPAWVRVVHDLYARGVKGPTHVDLNFRSRFRDEAQVTFEYFKALHQATNSPRLFSLHGHHFVNEFPEFRKTVSTLSNLRASHLGVSDRVNLAGLKIVQLADVLNGLSGMSMAMLSVQNQHLEHRSSLIYRWTRAVPAVMVTALGAYVLSRGITAAMNDSDLNETILEAYAGFYMIQMLTYGTGAALRIASQLISGCGDNKIGVPGLTELHGILDTHITYLNRFHSANRMFPATASNLQKVFREEFAGSSQVTSEECDQFISNFTSIPVFDLNGLTTFVGDFVDVEGLNPTQIDTRSRMVIRLMELAITGVASAKKPLDKSIRNHVENYFHGIWARLYGDDSPGILHDIRYRPERSIDLPKALVKAGDALDDFANSIVFSLDGIAARFLRETALDRGRRHPNSRLDPITIHAVTMMLNVAAYGILSIGLAKSSKEDEVDITPDLPSDDDFQASMSAASLLVMNMAFSHAGLVLSTLGAGLELLGERLDLSNNPPPVLPIHAGQASGSEGRLIFQDRKMSLVKAMVLFTIAASLPHMHLENGKQPTALLTLFSTLFHLLAADQIMRMRRT